MEKIEKIKFKKGMVIDEVQRRLLEGCGLLSSDLLIHRHKVHLIRGH